MSRMEDTERAAELAAARAELEKLKGGKQAAKDFMFLRGCLKVAKAVSKEAFGAQSNAQTALTLLELMARMPKEARDAALDAGEASFEEDD